MKNLILNAALLLIFCLSSQNSQAQQMKLIVKPAVLNNRLCTMYIIKNGYKKTSCHIQGVSSCEDYVKFIGLFPDFVIPEKILSQFIKCKQ